MHLPEGVQLFVVVVVVVVVVVAVAVDSILGSFRYFCSLQVLDGE